MAIENIDTVKLKNALNEVASLGILNFRQKKNKKLLVEEIKNEIGDIERSAPQFTWI